jgi:hypothetical protein
MATIGKGRGFASAILFVEILFIGKLNKRAMLIKIEGKNVFNGQNQVNVVKRPGIKNLIHKLISGRGATPVFCLWGKLMLPWLSLT